MTKLTGFSVLTALLAAAVFLSPISLSTAYANGVHQATPKRAAVAKPRRQCRVGRYDPYCGCCYSADRGVFHPYRYYYSRYPYFAEPFPHGFWWW